MRTLLCQINTTPGDFQGNTDKIKQAITDGFTQLADLIVLPELTIPGYLCRDLLFAEGFVEKNLERLREIMAHYDVCSYEYSGIAPTVVLGYVDRNTSGVGKPFRNVAVAIRKGSVISTYYKRLLPFYDVFDEGRYFEPGKELTVIEINGKRFGICICEDVWNDKGMDDYHYRQHPVQEYREIGVRDLISLNSSPFVKGKPQVRENMLRQITAEGGSVIYVNQIGGQDELVFDGNSLYCVGGEIQHRLHTTGGECHVLFDDKSPPAFRFHQPKPIETLWEVLKIGLRDYVKKSGFQDVVVSSSGGIDSALVLALACEVFGPEHVHAIRQPSILSSEHSVEDALQLHKNLKCWDYLIPFEHGDRISELRRTFEQSILKPFHSVANENLQARIRGNTLMYFSNAYNIFPLTTGNKTELAVGYFTLYGDSSGGFAPINDLYKRNDPEYGSVLQLAEYVNQKAGTDLIPKHILHKPPSAELAPDQTDEQSLLPYPILDAIVKTYVEDYITDLDSFLHYIGGSKYDNRLEIIRWYDTDISKARTQYERITRLISINEFKRRQAAPGVKVCRIAFGTGRRLPLVKR